MNERDNAMTMTPEQATQFAEVFDRMVRGVEQVLLGKQHVIRLAFTALLSEGHLLLEDVPGTGKTRSPPSRRGKWHQQP
jgi:MoxR-like ATPase